MENKNMFESFSEMQKQAAETFTNAAENMQKAMMGGAAVDFNSDFFKKWYDSQMAWFNQAQGDNKNNQSFEFFNNWMNSQMNMAKNWHEMSENMFKGMPQMANMTSEYTNMMNMFNSWKETMNGSYSEMMKNFNNGTAQTSFSGLFNNAEMYMKMFELMMPMMKSLNDKTFTPDMFKSMFNTGMYKEMMDKMFNMQPDFMKNMMGNMTGDMKENMGKMMDMNKNMFDTMKNNMSAQMNNMMPNDMMGTMMNNYNNWYNQVNSAFAPLTKLMPGTQGQNMEMMKEMSNMLTMYNMKNSQMQYMMYTTGTKSMEILADSLYNKMRNGEDMKNFMTVYQEWLNIHDKQFIALFETDEYSKLMGEVSAMQLTLKKNIDKQMEKAMGNLPLINRTEMDDLYKTIQELKKRINMLEKQIDNDTVVSEEPKAAKKAAKNA